MVYGAIVGLALAFTGQAEPSGWRLSPPANGQGPLLVLQAEQVSYRFACTASDVTVTETGVTKLMDLKTGAAIGDDAAAVMPPGAAVMALYSGKGDPRFRPAEAVKNPAGGWDLTIHVAKDDKQLTTMAKSDMMSLFTTGYTMAVQMDGAARDQWRTFMAQCASFR
jgi:hypothetical protein